MAASSSTGVFAISVAAEMASMEIQNLRVYERRGLIEPDRTAGGTRLYSPQDIERLVRIRELLAEGLNLAGISRVLVLETEVTRLRAANTRLRQGLGAVEGRPQDHVGGTQPGYRPREQDQSACAPGSRLSVPKPAPAHAPVPFAVRDGTGQRDRSQAVGLRQRVETETVLGV